MKTFLAIVAVEVMAIGGIEQAQAATELYWDANGAAAGTGGTGNWDTSSLTWRSGSSTGELTNWVDGSAPRFTGTAGTVTLKENVAIDGANYGAGAGIKFDTSGYTVNTDTGSKLTINSGGQSPFYANNTVTLSAPLLLARNGLVYLECSNNVTINGNISVGGTSTQIAVWGGTLTLNGNNSFGSGGGNGGYYYNLVIGSNNALGSGTLRVGQFPGSYANTLAAGPANPTINNPIETSWDQELRFAGNNSLTLASDETYLSLTASTSGFRINVQQAPATLTFASLTEGGGHYRNGAFRKMGAGTVVINGQYGCGANTYVTDGTLILNGPTGDKISDGPVQYQGQQDYIVSPGAKLGGNGTIWLASGKSVTLNAGTSYASRGGILSPGQSIGKLNVTGNVAFGDYAVYLWDANGNLADNDPNKADLLAVSGTGAGNLSFGNNAIIKLGDWIGDPTLDTFTLFSYTGTLTAPQNWFIDTSGTGWVGGTVNTSTAGVITLSGLVPEPGTVTLLALAGLTLLRRRRR